MVAITRAHSRVLPWPAVTRAVTCNVKVMLCRSRQLFARLRAVTVLTDNGSVQWFHVPIIYKHMQASDGSDEREASADVFCRRPERVKRIALFDNPSL